MDRNLDPPTPEARASGPSEPPGPPDLADAFDDEVTHMVSSLDELKALKPASREQDVRASLYDRDEDDAATRVAPSTSETSRPSTPPPRNTPPPRRPSSPVQRAVTAPADKPLWYVDLGGAETVQMTIEQVIIARRSGKLGEGALVWRAGMPDWRPVGTLIPASSSPSNAPPPAPPASAEPPPPNALGSYERPVPTLEFALEKGNSASPHEEQTKTPAPVRVRGSAPPPPRPPTPIPRAAAARGHSQVGPLPPPAPLPAPRTPTPVPPPPPLALAAADSSAAPDAVPEKPPSVPPKAMVSSMPLLGRASPTPPADTSLLSRFHYPWPGQRPRWASVAIALAVCIAASGSGAFVVRALKLRRQPLSLATTQLSATTFAATPAPPAVTAPSEPDPAAPAVVDVSSLSVEHHTPRTAPRAAALNAPALPISAPTLPKSSENSGSEESEHAPPPKKSKTSDLPSAAHSNPYTTGSVDDAPTKKSGSDEPGF